MSILPKPLILSLCLGVLGGISHLRAQEAADQRVIVVTLDGMRWQEVFRGADSALAFGRAGGVRDTGDLRRRFWRPTAEERRAALLPFFWREIAVRGQVLGDSAAGSTVRLTNGKRFSYPGYNELFGGAPDDRIDSNDKIPNPNVTVLEWLHQQEPFRGRIAVFGSWDVFPFIFNAERSGIPVTALGPPFPDARSPTQRLINEYTADLPRLWAGAALDAPVMQAALETMQSQAPRVLVILLGETDEWAHTRRYDLYLDAARRADRFLERLWEMAQSLEGYRGNTSLLVSTDHGRGAGDDWTDHGREVPAADRIWMAVMGPAIPSAGVRRGAEATQSQFAATIAGLVGEDFHRARPGVAPPILNLRGRREQEGNPPAAQDTGRARLLAVARGIIARARYAGLVTVDSTGAPQARTVEPLAPDSGFTVWIGTNPRTRKVEEIRRNPAVVLYWFDPTVLGYVTLRGRADLVDDPAEKQRRWKPGWEAFYPDRTRDFLLIQVRPMRLEIVSPRDRITGDSLTWRPPMVRWP